MLTLYFQALQSPLGIELTPVVRTTDSGGEDYFTHAAGAAYDFRRDTQPNCGKGCSQVDWEDKSVYSTTVFSREACKVIAAHPFAEKPLFLYLAYQVRRWALLDTATLPV